MASPVLTFVIVGHKDHPIFYVDLINKAPDASVCLFGVCLETLLVVDDDRRHP